MQISDVSSSVSIESRAQRGQSEPFRERPEFRRQPLFAVRRLAELGAPFVRTLSAATDDLQLQGKSIILLVDDNEDLRAYVGSVLRKGELVATHSMALSA